MKTPRSAQKWPLSNALLAAVGENPYADPDFPTINVPVLTYLEALRTWLGGLQEDAAAMVAVASLFNGPSLFEAPSVKLTLTFIFLPASATVSL